MTGTSTISVVHAIGLGLEQTAAYLGLTAPTFEAFERWIAATTGGIEPERVARINAAVDRRRQCRKRAGAHSRP